MGLNYGFYATWALNIQKQPLENNKFEYDMSRFCSHTVKIGPCALNTCLAK